jgi:hypothetical protein
MDGRVPSPGPHSFDPVVIMHSTEIFARATVVATR